MTVVTWTMSAVDGLSIDDIQEMPENVRVELHNGDLMIKLPGTPWHEKVAEAITPWFAARGRFAATNPGIRRTARHPHPGRRLLLRARRLGDGLPLSGPARDRGRGVVEIA